MPVEPRIAIVGMGGVFPAAPGPRQLWARVAAADDVSRDVPAGRWLLDPADVFEPHLARTDRVYSRRGYFVEEIPLRIEEFDLPRGLLAEMDPVFHLALEAGRQAFAAAATRQLDRRRIGVILGNIALPTEADSTLARGLLGRTFEEKLLGQAPAAFAVRPACGTALPAGLLARALGLGGGSCTLDAACASSLYALKLAAEELRAGRADAMLAGGVSRPDCLYTQMGFSQLRALSPTGCCRPFDAGADGLVVGEGAGVFLLKRLEDALRDGDLVLAVLAGIGLSNDVGGSLLAPSSEGQLRAMDDAYREAGWVPADVDLIECHATGTPLGDAVEFCSLRALWGEHGWKPGQCVIGSVKSTVGHLLTAAGAAALVKVLSAFGAETLPPTANFRAPAPGLDYEGSPFRVLNESRYWPRRRPDLPRRAAISGFGFGGINAHVLLEEAPVVATGGSPVVFLPPDRKASCPSLRSERQAGRLAVRNVPVAVVGMEACFGPWRSLQAFQERVLGGGDPAKPQPPRHWWGIPESHWFQAAGPRGLLFAGFYLDGPIAVAVNRFRIPPRELRDMLPQQLLMLQVAAGALACAPVRPDCRARAGVYLGMGIDFNTTNFHFRWWVLKNARAWAERKGGHPDAAEVEEWVRALADAAGPPLTADRTMGALASIAASRIARELHLGGSSFTLCGEENSGLRALEAAVRALQRSEIDQALAGAVDLAGDVRAVLGRRLFDPATEGGVIGEGAAAVVLKRLPDAVADGDTIHAVIKGIGTASGGEGDFPDEAACREALARACREAEMDLDSAASLHPESARADVGDAGAASGLASFVKACLGLARKTTAAEPRHASVRSCGRDGTCTLVILEGGEEGPVGRDSDPDRACQDGIPNARGPTVEVPIGGRPFVLPYTPWDQENRDTVAPQIAQAAATAGATGLAHAAYLRLAQALHRGITSSLSFQTTLLEAFLASGGRQPPVGLQVKKQGADAPRSPVRFDRRQCLEFAAGSIGRVLGPAFAAIDAHPTRVRLPDEPLMLVDRILAVEGEPLSLASGRVVTEHDVLPGAWYLDGNRVPTCIAVEAGQADLFLSAYLGIDLRTRGRAVYRLLDAVVTFHRGLPGPGAIIHYDIHIDRFFRQGDTHLFRFRFEGTVGGEPLLTMTDGCAGFFTPAELSAGKGVVQTALNRQPRPGRRAEGEEDLAPPAVESYADEQIDALRAGDLATAFGPPFRGLTLTESLRLPGGRMRLVHRVVHLDPQGGRFGIGLIRAEADIHPDDWFLTCHFVDDQVMPGTLMYECCLHTLRIFLLRLGWVATRGEPDHFGSRCAGGSATGAEPVPGVAGRLRCRGQVTPATRTVTCEVTCKERGYGPAPYALADALICADGKPIVEITDMSLRLSGLDREQVTTLWQRQGQRGARTQHVIAGPARVPCFRGPSGSWEGPPSGLGRESVPPPTEPLVPETCTNLSPPCAFPKERILAFAVGKPSEAFGEPYRVFDAERVIARLPGPPFGFLDRIVRIEAEPWKMVAGGVALAEYDVPPDAWYFTDERQPAMPFAVLLEVALQPCGWLAAYVGSALTSPEDLSFRNLGGEAVLHAPVGPDVGTLSTRVRLASVASSGGTILQHYDFEVRSSREIIYGGKTSFGFFPRAALAHQVGIQGARPYEPSAAERARGRAFPFPLRGPLPGGCLRMVDRIDLDVPDGGPRGLGLIEGSKDVDPDEWFFQAHFYQDPVWPGSLGLESFVQLLKVAALQRWPAATRLQVAGGSAHRWLYRGQVVPGDRRVAVQAVVTACEETEAGGHLTADGWLLVDGRAIYRMNDFTLSAGRAR